MYPVKIFVIIAAALLSTGSSMAQGDEPCPCCSESHRAFDFWVGDWNVYNTEDKLVGTNRIVSMQDGCVLQENWVASDQSNTGTSYNYFDGNDSTWNQLWISNTGYILKLKGNVDRSGAMILRSELLKSPKGTYYHQISWTKNKDGSVTQRWDILNKDGDLINKAFEGIYRKKQQDAP